ncbi:hypothetical protein [Carnobacterium antarcticum]|uniref:YokE-like PH domain-containing protein n=1 Tax=Carnobacterium antarcticum TaxID=2126436 RepID=A0ABW4NNR8_9LACT|nr:hypothetical protein [Carnobacterium sp. CP1]ALV22621.1 hypothetical protein NY10_2034 [Carnobacterium sp. CP1]
MNEAMKVENIKEYMKPLDVEVSQNFVYGYTEPGLLSSFTYGALASFVDMSHFLLVFSPEEIVLVGLTLMGDFADTYVRIPRKDIELSKAKKGLIQYKIELKVKGDKKLKFKANKMIAAAKWQKGNIAFLESNNWYQP